MKSVHKLFRLTQATLCLANEWRDTLAYTVGTAYAGTEILQGHKGWLSAFLFAVTAREASRALLWAAYEELRLAGDNSGLVPAEKNAWAAVNVYVGSFAISDFSISFFMPNAMIPSLVTGTPVALFGIVTYGALLAHGARLRDIPKLYFDAEKGMWDWPRRNGGNGPKQTQKLKKAISDFGKSRRLPRPALSAAGNRLTPLRASDLK
jgi:hypothetical protein